MIINADNHSEDKTKEKFLNTPTRTDKHYLSTKKGVRGKGNNIRNLLKQVIKLKAEHAVIVDADLKSINPQWMKLFIGPLTKGYDFVAPYYSRHKYDATITNHICFPLVYGLAGVDLRQPIGGDFAFSRELAKYWIRKKWSTTTYHYGIDNFMSLNAVFGGFKICQAGLGTKIHKPSAPKLGRMFVEVIYTLFDGFVKNKNKWMRKTSIEQLPMFGTKRTAKPQKLHIDEEIILKTSIADYKIYKEDIKSFLLPETFKRINLMYKKNEINIDPELWARVVYELMYHFHIGNTHLKIVKSLKSLYFGRVYSYIMATRHMNNKDAEKEIIKQADTFFGLRNYLIEKIKNQ